jgi:hypothetical protein
MSYQVYAEDNFHSLHTGERHALGEFDSAQAATTACRRLVDTFLRDNYRAGMSAHELYETYVSLGEDPFIVSARPTAAEPSVRFCAWDYAKARSEEVARQDS